MLAGISAEGMRLGADFDSKVMAQIGELENRLDGLCGSQMVQIPAVAVGADVNQAQ